MAFSRFIATRLASQGEQSFTRIIIRIATIAVGVSVAVMIITNALVTGFKKEISEKVYGFWGHINIMDIRADNSYEALPITYDPELLASIRSIGGVEVDYGAVGQGETSSYKGVEHVQVVAHVPAIIDTREQIEGIVIKGVDSTFNWSILERFLAEGSLLDVAAADPEEQLIISRYTADRLQVEVGDQFVVNSLKNDRQVQRRFGVAGIYRTGLEDYDKKFALAPLPIVQDLLGWTNAQVGGYEVFVEHVDDARIINDYIYLEELPSELFSQTIRARFPNIFEWLDLQDMNQMVILGLTLIVAALNMISVLLILILERTRMIGVLKALGSKSWPVQRIFLYHAGIIISRGLLLGNVIGIGLCLVQKYFKPITLNESDYYLSYAPVNFNVLHVLVINASTLLLIMLFLLVPTLLVVRIKPVRTIQFR